MADEWGYTARKDSHLKRLRRVEGQVRGLQRMVDEDKYCIDILTQVSAATKALQSLSLGLLEEHLAHCVAEAAQRGGADAEEKLREASDAIARFSLTAPRPQLTTHPERRSDHEHHHDLHRLRHDLRPLRHRRHRGAAGRGGRPRGRRRPRRGRDLGRAGRLRRPAGRAIRARGRRRGRLLTSAARRDGVAQARRLRRVLAAAFAAACTAGASADPVAGGLAPDDRHRTPAASHDADGDMHGGQDGRGPPASGPTRPPPARGWR